MKHIHLKISEMQRKRFGANKALLSAKVGRMLTWEEYFIRLERGYIDGK